MKITCFINYHIWAPSLSLILCEHASGTVSVFLVHVVNNVIRAASATNTVIVLLVNNVIRAASATNTVIVLPVHIA